MDADGNIYHGENVPPEDQARLDGYLRGLAHGADDEGREAIDALRWERNDAMAEAARQAAAAKTERLARDLSDRLRIDAETRLREFEGGDLP